MNVTEILDEVKQHTDNIMGSPADYTDRRARLLVYLRETVDDLWWLRDWPWRMKRSTVTFTNGEGIVPVDFHDWGHDGALYNNENDAMDVADQRTVMDLRERNYQTATPRLYSMFGLDDSGMAPTYRKLIQIPYGASLTLPIYYLSLPPTLDEGANVNAIKRVPEQYHRSVIVPGVRYRAERSKSDARAAESKIEYEEGKKAMLRKESRDSNRLVRLQSFFNYRHW